MYEEPLPEDYDSVEEYRRALAAYDAAYDAYEDDYIERRREE